MSRAFETTRSRANFRSSACSVGKCAISAAWALALLSGCGSGGPSDLADEASADEPSSTLTREVLDRLDLGGYELSFERVSTGQGPDTVMLVETLYASDRLEGLTRAYGPLTSLETFLAFAPEGGEPHPFLVAAHESEAQGLGRSGEGLAVRFVDGRNLPIEKAIAFECGQHFGSYTDIEPFVASDNTFNIINVDGVNIFTCLGAPLHTGSGTTPTGCKTFHPSKLLRMSACNDSARLNAITVFMTLSGITSRFPDTITPPAISIRYNFPPVSPVPQFFQNRSLALRSQNNPANPENQQIHVGIVGTL